LTGEPLLSERVGQRRWRCGLPDRERGWGFWSRYLVTNPRIVGAPHGIRIRRGVLTAKLVVVVRLQSQAAFVMAPASAWVDPYHDQHEEPRQPQARLGPFHMRCYRWRLSRCVGGFRRVPPLVVDCFGDR